jgi:hypothetical protein
MAGKQISTATETRSRFSKNRAIARQQPVRDEAVSNTSTVALRVVGGNEKGTQCLGCNWATCSWGYKYGDVALLVGGVSNLTQ